MDKTNTLKQICNPYSTGGGGVDFERKVQSVFLLSLLVDGCTPVIFEKIQQIDYQGKHLGYETDDLIVTSSNPKRTKLLCQIKSDITISEKNAVFQSVISAAWSDFNNEGFRKGEDKLLLITGVISKRSYDSMTKINTQANCTPCATAFLRNIDTACFIDKHTRTVLTILTNCLTKANNGTKPSDDEIYDFCKSFTLLVFDLDYENSINQMLIYSIIGCKTDKDARDIWCRLEGLSASYNKSAASVTVDMIPHCIKDSFVQQSTAMTAPISIQSFASSEAIAMLALFGSWDENNTYDQAAIAEITGYAYRKFEAKAKEMLTLNNPFIKYNSGIWSINNRRQLLMMSGKFFFDRELIRAFKFCEYLLKQKSKHFTEANKYSHLVPQGGAYDNSDALRNGLIKGLCILTNNLDWFPNLTVDTITNCSIALICKVFDNCDWIRLVSIGDLLPFISEMAPEQYIKMLEIFVVNNPADIIRLLPKNGGDFLFNSGFIYYVIWSIEAITWIENCLVQGISCLGEIARILYSSDCVSNEVAVDGITSILLPWYPQTLASAEKQKRAVKGLLTSCPEVAWRVIMKLMPHGTLTAMGAYKPKCLRCDIPNDVHVSEERYNDLSHFYLDLALELAESSVSRLDAISELSYYMSSTSFLSYLDKIMKSCAGKQDNEKYLLWIRLSDLRNSVICNNGKIEPGGECYKRLCDTIESLEPHNIFYKYQKLFLAKLDFCSLDNDANWRKEAEEKVDAVFEIFVKQGVDAVLKFGICVNNKTNIGAALGSRISNVDFDSIIVRLHEKSIDRDFAMSVVDGFVRSNGVFVWRNMNLLRFEPEFIASLLSMVILSSESIEVMRSLLNEKEFLFWKIVRMPYAFFEGADYCFSNVVMKLIEVERPVVALNYCGQSMMSIIIDNDLIYRVLEMAATIPDVVMPNRYAVWNLIGKLQNDDAVDIERLSKIELCYLQYLDRFSSLRPRAMHYRISNQPSYFCEILKYCFKAQHEEISNSHDDKMVQQLFDLVFNFCVVPGTDWNGTFHRDIFKSWISEVQVWSKDNGRYMVAMQTIGQGLTYAAINDGLHDSVIMEALNAVDADQMRLGYQIGVMNKQGTHFVDPEGKVEYEKAQMYNENADKAEDMGYSRIAQMYRDIANGFIEQVEDNRRIEQEYKDKCDI